MDVEIKTRPIYVPTRCPDFQPVMSEYQQKLKIRGQRRLRTSELIPPLRSCSPGVILHEPSVHPRPSVSALPHFFFGRDGLLTFYLSKEMSIRRRFPAHEPLNFSPVRA